MARAEMWAPRRHRIVRAQVGNATRGKPPLQGGRPGGGLPTGCKPHLHLHPYSSSSPSPIEAKIALLGAPTRACEFRFSLLGLRGAIPV